VLIRREGKWIHRSIEDPASNVLHKAMVYSPTSGNAGILTAGGTRAILKLWEKGAEPEIVWEADFGGKFSRMREMEAVATHDQGVVAGGQVEILRFEAGTEPRGGTKIASLEDKLCRFLTVGDIDGDGRKEMVDADSRGFEHAAILVDLDGDKTDELYVANDMGGEVNRYVWREGSVHKTTIHKYPEELSYLTWNINAAPVELIP